MIQAHIMDGDLVFVRKQETAGSGDIVAAMLDGEATVKRFTRESGAVVLRPEHPTMKPIVVEAGQDQMGAYVSVLDDGGGVPDDALARVFDVGFRADEARSPGGGGGLGLAIARSLVEAHRGRITVCNENGGARFTVWLPLEQVDR